VPGSDPALAQARGPKKQERMAELFEAAVASPEVKFRNISAQLDDTLPVVNGSFY
jgi:hypothetical protein